MALIDLTAEDRRRVQEELLASGWELTDSAFCGEGGSPCGVCDQCLSQLEECERCRESVPPRCWPAATHDAVGRAVCRDCAERG